MVVTGATVVFGACGWPSEMVETATAEVFGACGWPSEMVETATAEVFGACGWPSEMVETATAEVGACGWPLRKGQLVLWFGGVAGPGHLLGDGGHLSLVLRGGADVHDSNTERSSCVGRLASWWCTSLWSDSRGDASRESEGRGLHGRSQSDESERVPHVDHEHVRWWCTETTVQDAHRLGCR